MKCQMKHKSLVTARKFNTACQTRYPVLHSLFSRLTSHPHRDTPMAHHSQSLGKRNLAVSTCLCLVTSRYDTSRPCMHLNVQQDEIECVYFRYAQTTTVHLISALPNRTSGRMCHHSFHRATADPKAAQLAPAFHLKKNLFSFFSSFFLIFFILFPSFSIM